MHSHTPGMTFEEDFIINLGASGDDFVMAWGVICVTEDRY